MSIRSNARCVPLELLFEPLDVQSDRRKPIEVDAALGLRQEPRGRFERLEVRIEVSRAHEGSGSGGNPGESICTAARG